MIGTEELLMYDSDVPWIGEYCGGPSRFGVNEGPFFSGTVAVCGIEFSMTATCASGVPATVGSTAAASEPAGIFANPGGSALLGDEGPGTGHRGRTEPASGQQHVVVVAVGVDQDVGGGVRRPEQRRADDGHEIGLTLEHDQLRGNLRRVDRRDAVGERRLRVGLGPAVEQVDGAGLGQRLRDVVGRVPHERTHRGLASTAR